LNLGSQDEVSEAVARIRADISVAKPGATPDRFLVERMAPAPSLELILGVKRHAALGLALLVGRGGVDAEAHRDYALTLLPARECELERALDRLGIRALAPKARRSVLDAMRALAGFAEDHADVLAELDINPLLVLEDGSASAVDALVVLNDESQDDPHTGAVQ
jgi:succinyl-CoA synthetase beta subunit